MNIIDYTHLIPNQTKTITKKLGITFHITTDKNKYQALNWFKNPNANASSHYIIEKDGEIGMCVDPRYIAWHNGIVRNPTANIIKDNRGNPNHFMIGIEVVAKKGDELTAEQTESLVFLTKKLCKEHKFAANVYHLIGHNEVNSIDKIFCPISVYQVSYIISLINQNYKRKTEEQVEKKDDKYDILIEDNKFLKVNNIELIAEVERLDKLVKKERDRNSDLKEIYKEKVKDLQELREINRNLR